MKISPEILSELQRVSKSAKRFERLIFQVAIELGFCQKRPSETADQLQYVEIWERTLNYLDGHHPGWRGYLVQTATGGLI
jgi:hypothetical protein